jgi:hypothetical protein
VDLGGDIPCRMWWRKLGIETPSAVSVEATSATFPQEILISPDGTVFATTAGVATSGANPGTNLWTSNATLITGMTGFPVGWIDDGHLLVNTYTNAEPGMNNTPEYAGCNV